jgi:hypothetical protein
VQIAGQPSGELPTSHPVDLYHAPNPTTNVLFHERTAEQNAEEVDMLRSRAIQQSTVSHSSTESNAPSVVININTGSGSAGPTGSAPNATSLLISGQDIQLNRHAAPGSTHDRSTAVIPTDLDSLQCHVALWNQISLEIWAQRYDIEANLVLMLQEQDITGPCSLPWLTSNDWNEFGLGRDDVIILMDGLVRWLLDGTDMHARIPDQEQSFDVSPQPSSLQHSSEGTYRDDGIDNNDENMDQ